jgi:hypothetical protein
LYVDGEPAGTGQLERTIPLVFSYDETTDVGRDSGSAVSEDYDADRNEFPDVINWVQIETGNADNGTSYRPRIGGGSPWPGSDPGTQCRVQGLAGWPKRPNRRVLS